MGKYTTEVRFICESSIGLTDSTGYKRVNEIIQCAIPKIFDFDFPMYDESYRNVLCGKILKHYYTREICAETVGLWKLWLDSKMNEIMPYYNQLYKSAIIEFDPMYDIDLTTTHTRGNTGNTTVQDIIKNNASGNNSKNSKINSTTTIKNTNKENISQTNETTTGEGVSGETQQSGTNSGNKTHKDLYSDTPQGSLDNVENETYLTNARKITDTSSDNNSMSGTFTTQTEGVQNNTISGENNSEFNGSNTAENSENITGSFTNKFNGNNESKTNVTSTEEYIQKIVGKTGGSSYSKRLQEFRNTFLNIDMMIIEELKDLFFNLW